jgi:hypothetical protein
MKNKVVIIHIEVGIFNGLGNHQTSMDQSLTLQSNSYTINLECDQ